MSRILLVGLLAGLLTACGISPPRTAPAGAETSAVQARRAALLAGQVHWRMTGRIAVSDGRDGGSGRIEWVNDGARLQITLNAPVTRRSWRLQAEPGFARLEGLDGGPFEARAAEQLLAEKLGWSVPLADLAAWARGLQAAGPAEIRFQPSGLPEVIEQFGWRIEYREFDPVAGLSMPRRVFVSRGKQRIRLQVDAWSLPGLDP